MAKRLSMMAVLSKLKGAAPKTCHIVAAKRAQVKPAQQLGVECDDDCTHGHQQRANRWGQCFAEGTAICGESRIQNMHVALLCQQARLLARRGLVGAAYTCLYGALERAAN